MTRNTEVSTTMHSIMRKKILPKEMLPVAMSGNDIYHLKYFRWCILCEALCLVSTWTVCVTLILDTVVICQITLVLCYGFENRKTLMCKIYAFLI